MAPPASIPTRPVPAAASWSPRTVRRPGHRPDLALLRGDGGRPRGGALAASLGGDGVRGSGARGPRSRRSRPLPRRRGGLARARPATPAWTDPRRRRPPARPGPPRRDGLHRSPAGQGRRLVRVRPELARPAGAAPDRDPGRRHAHGFRGGERHRRPCPRASLGRAGRARPRPRAKPKRDGGAARLRSPHHRRGAAVEGYVPAPRGHVLGCRRPWPHRQGGPCPARRPPVPRGARRPERPPPPRRQRPREHDLRVPSRGAHVPRRHPGAPRPHRGPHVQDRRRRGHDPPRCRRRRGRAARPGPPGVREGSRGARASSWRRSGTCSRPSRTRWTSRRGPVS